MGKVLVGLLSINSLRLFKVFVKKNPEFEPIFYIPDYLDEPTKAKLKRVCKYEFSAEAIVLSRPASFSSRDARDTFGVEFNVLFLYGTNHFELNVLIECYKSAKVVIYEDGTLTYCDSILKSLPRIDEVYISNYANILKSKDLEELPKVDVILLSNKNVTFELYRQTFAKTRENFNLDFNNIVLIIDSNYSAVGGVISEEEEIMMIYQLYGFIKSLGFSPIVKWHPRRAFKNHFAFSKILMVPTSYNLEEFLYAYKNNVEFIIGNISTSMLSALHYFNIPSIISDNAILFDRRISKRPKLADAIKSEIELYFSVFPRLSSIMKSSDLGCINKRLLLSIIHENIDCLYPSC